MQQDADAIFLQTNECSHNAVDTLQVENTLKMQMIISTVLMTPVSC